VKKWLFAAGLGLAMAASASVQAADSIAVVNMGNLFQQVAQSTGVSKTLENEFSVKKVADDKGYDVVLDTNTVAYAGSSVKDITSDVLKQVK